MHRIFTRWWAVGVAAIAMLVAVVGCGDDSSGNTEATADRSGFTLTALEAGGDERGAGYLEQDGDRLRGWIVVWGLEPDSHHASHLHADPEGETDASCPDAQTDRHAIDFEDLTADANGVATHEIDVLVGERVVRPGVYWMVHAHGGHDHAGHGEHDPPAENPGLLCGDLVAGSAAR